MNTTISVAGTRTIENNIFLDSSFFIPFIKLYTAIIITILIILYIHNFIFTSKNPAPVKYAPFIDSF